jgi:hypothetical protein
MRFLSSLRRAAAQVRPAHALRRGTFKKVINATAAFQIFKQRPHRHARALESQAPPTFPGTRSTAGHLLQSNMRVNVSDSEPTRKAHDFVAFILDFRIVSLKIG